MEYKQADFARLANVTKPAINYQIKQGKLVLNNRKRLDDTNPINQAYLLKRFEAINTKVEPIPTNIKETSHLLQRLGKTLNIDKKVYKDKVFPSEIEIANRKVDLKNLEIPIPETNVSSIDTKDFSEKLLPSPQISKDDLLKEARKDFNSFYNGNESLENFVPTKLNELGLASANRLKMLTEISTKQEDLKTKQLKNAKDRQEVISRALIKKVFAKIYSIDMTQFKSLPPSITPQISSIAEIKDPAIQLKIEALLEKEIFFILQDIKLLLDDFLKDIKENPLIDDNINDYQEKPKIFNILTKAII